MQIGASYYGSSTLEKSTGSQELVPRGVVFYKFSFKPFQDCTVRINDSEPILILSETGFSMDEVDAYIHSFVVVEPDIEFTWIGGSR